LGPEAPLDDRTSPAAQILLPQFGDAVDLDRAVAAEAEQASYASQVTGTVLGHYYRGVLMPYQVVTVEGVNQRRSGDYLITQVTHTLTRTEYSQAFTLRRNARSAGAGGNFADLAGAIF
ncbi:MAG: hypothetical protein WBG38_12960, partial [Nodosilinea sp.]